VEGKSRLWWNVFPHRHIQPLTFIDQLVFPNVGMHEVAVVNQFYESASPDSSMTKVKKLPCR